MISNAKAGEYLDSCKGRRPGFEISRDYTKVVSGSHANKVVQSSSTEVETTTSYPTDRKTFSLQSQPDSTTVHLIGVHFMCVASIFQLDS